MSARLIDPALRLPPLPTIKDLLKLYRLRAIRQLSQNFLLEERITNRIAKAAGRLDGYYVCEVGPGPGGITRSILNRGAKKVLLIEKDKRFAPSLKMLSDCCPGRIDTYWGDVLSFNMSKLFPEEAFTPWEDDNYPPIHIIGNLPFSVATPLIIRWLSDISARTNAWSFGRVPMTLTFQHEVALRLTCDVGHPERSRISVMCQYLTHPEYRFSISGSAFLPKPNVDVGVVRFFPRKEPLIPAPFPVVEKVVRQMFSSKRKLSWKGARTLFPYVLRRKLTTELFVRADITPDMRPPNLEMADMSSLVKAYLSLCDEYPIKDYNNRAHKADDNWEKQYGHIYGYRKDIFPNQERPIEDSVYDYDDEDLMSDDDNSSKDTCSDDN